MVALASTDDVKAVLLRDLTAEEASAVDGLLDAASDQFRALSRQTFTPATSTVRLKVNGRRVRLDQRPAGDVLAAVDDDGKSVTYTRNGAWLTVDLSSAKFVTVTYEHGSDEVPSRVSLAVAEMVMRSLVTPEDVKAGARSTTDSAGQVSSTTAWSVRAKNEGLRMSDGDVELARSFWWPGGQVIVQAT